jgi:hypothetical protein
MNALEKLKAAPFKLPIWRDGDILVAANADLICHTEAAEPHELDHIIDAVNAIPALLEAVDALEYLVGHVSHYGTMQHAHPDAFRDAANARAILNKLQGI